MLVQFMLKNVLSFKEETILDMTAINAYKEHECNLIHTGTKEKFIRVAAIYGANASGKSNLYMAMTNKPSEYNPGTTVYYLVEELKRYLEE